RSQNRLGVITTVPGAAALWRRDVVLAQGGFSSDTLAEDTDLSVTLLCAGCRLVFQDRALAYTEAPVTPVALWRQRRRWLSGNLSCLRKHGLCVGAPLRVRLLGLPNLWFSHVGVYLLPLVVSAWIGLGRGGVALQPLVFLGGVALALDLIGLIGFYVADRADLRDLWHAPVQRMVFPSFLWGVFWSVVVTAPRAWAKIERRNTALLG
ncbi:MAG TPA: glycosyltransferase family 2 protein, partial [Deltaproteobacteria bacterium]|nr:glycosyltransferase family 2 protein [Deltaproteobacteria bacterium]